MKPQNATANAENQIMQLVSEWIDNHTDLVADAQQIAQEIHTRGLINMKRPLPFDIRASEDVNGVDGFDLHVFLDHPAKAQVYIRLRPGQYEFLPHPEHMSEPFTANTVEEAIEQVIRYDDADHKRFKELRAMISDRRLREINDQLMMWLIDYRNAIDPKLEEICDYLKGIEYSALLSPADGKSTPLTRIMGRWDLALLWTPCPFVVVGDADKTLEVRKRVTEFTQFETRTAALLCSAQMACMVEGNYDIQLQTDSPDGAADGSGWLGKDPFGMPQLGPIIHAQHITAHSQFDIIARNRIVRGI